MARPLLSCVAMLRVASCVGLGLAVLGGCTCAPAEPEAKQEISREWELVSLPGWRNEGPLRTGALHRVSGDPDARFHAWTFAPTAPADVWLAAGSDQSRLRVLGRTETGWRLVSATDGETPFRRELGAGEYLVVVQTALGEVRPWTLTAACYGAGCPIP
jgi:hypothetical protein